MRWWQPPTAPRRSTRSSARAARFDLLLTDIKMPVMDGIALALAAARDFPELPIVLMTGYADQRERASGLEALVSDVIAKPFTVAEIRFAVAAALAKRQATSRSDGTRRNRAYRA